MWNLTYLVTGFIFIILLVAIFFSKEVLSSKENMVFKYILIANVLEYLIEIPLQILVRTIDINNILVDIFCRLYLISITISYILFTLYVFVICLDRFKKNYNKWIKNSKIYLIIFETISISLLLFLPFSKYYDASKMYISGSAIDFLKIFIVLQIVVYVILLLINYKKLRNKKYLPIYFVIICLVFMTLLNSVDPSILITSMITTFICYTMFFTIENPDVKMIQELKKNKKIIEQGNEDKANFLFRMSQEVKKTIDDILRVSRIIVNSDDMETIKKGVRYIDSSSNELNSIVNNVLDVSKMDTYNIKIFPNTYNVHNLFKELYTRFDGMNNKNIEFRHSISRNIPKMLYGDSIKIKQVITTILQNAFDHTKEGYIDVNVDSIIKNDVCRLIVSISDSGIGMSLDKVNELLSLSEEMNDEDIEKLNQSNLNLNIATKIIKLLGGQIIIKSEENVGSEFIITFEQIIKQKIEDNINNKYNNIFLGKKRLLIVEDKQAEINMLLDYLKEHNFDITVSMYGEDCLERIKNNQKFDLIIMEDEMIQENAINVMQKLKDIKHFKTPVIVMLDKNKEVIKDHYVKDGFNDYLLKEDFKHELERVIKEYIK